MQRRLFLSKILMIPVVLVGCVGSQGGGGGDEPEGKNEHVLDRKAGDKSMATEAVLHTTKGDIRIKLFGDKVPKTVKSFGRLVGLGFYKNIQIHRIIENFMVQTGCPRGDGTGDPSDRGIDGYPFDDEFHEDLRHHKEGMVSMANSGPNTNGSQFFITLAPCDWLDGKHAIFGEVVEGIEVLRDIGNSPIDREDRPLKEILLKDVTIFG